MMFEEVVRQRHSVRKFGKGFLTHEEIAGILLSSTKVPSAGGIRALKTIPITGDSTKLKLFDASGKQNSILNAACCFIVICDFEKIKKRYGKRGIRYGYMEAGHIGQNIALQAVSLGLGSVMIGAFNDREVKEALGINEDPLYIIPVGKP